MHRVGSPCLKADCSTSGLKSPIGQGSSVVRNTESFLLTVYSVINYSGDEAIDRISPDCCWKIGLKRLLRLSYKPERRKTMDLHYEVQGKGEAVVLIHSGGAD